MQTDKKPTLTNYTLALLIAASFKPAITNANEPDSGQLLNQQNKLNEVFKPQKSEPKNIIEQPKPTEQTEPTNVGGEFFLMAVNFGGDSDVLDQAALQALISEYLNKTLSFDALKAINEKVTQYIRQQGYIVGYAYLPEQKISSGTLTINTLLGKLYEADGIIVNNKQKHIKDEAARKALSKALLDNENHYLNKQMLERGMLLVNDLAGVDYASVSIQKGIKQGSSQLLLDIKETKRFQTNLYLDNYGNRFTGQGRATAQLSVNNPLSIGDALTLQATKTVENTQGSIGYKLPINDNGLTLSTNINYLDYSLGKTFSDLNATGKALSATVTADYPFIRAYRKNLWGKVSLETRQLKSSLLGTTTQDRNIKLLRAEVYGNLHDNFGKGGVTSYSAAINAGNVDLSDVPQALQADQASANTQGAYQLLQASLSRHQYFNNRYSLYGRLSMQYADQNLDSSEQFFLGGPDGIRAYPVGEGSGDRGWLINLEARADTQILKGPSELQLIAFFDIGGTTLHANPWTNAINTATNQNTYTIKGAGVGLNYQYKDKFNISASVSRAIGDNPGRDTDGNNVDGRNQDTQLWVQAQLHF